MSDPTPKTEKDQPEGLDKDNEADITSETQEDETLDADTEQETVEDTTPEQTDDALPVEDDVEAAEETAEHASDADDADTIEDAELVDEPVGEEPDSVAEDASDNVDAPVSYEAASETGTEATPEPDPEPVESATAPVTETEKKSGGFFGPFLGGVVAAGLGYGLCYFLVGQGILPSGEADPFAEERAQITALEGQVAALGEELRGELAGLGEDPRVGPLSDGLSAVQAAMTDVQSEIGTLQGEIEAQNGLIGGMQAELDAIAEMPAGTGGADTAAVAALQVRLQEQQAANEEMQDQLQQMAEDARAEMEDVRSRAGALQSETQAAVDDATNRAALANLTAALESGTPLAPALANITGDVPDALGAASDTGVLTVLELQRAFPAAARAGLSDSLKVTVGDAPTDRIFAFLQAQVGARSLEGREGDDPDAILSRAQEAVSSANFADALAEIAALPPEGQLAMSSWTSDAQARVDAVAARDALAAELISN